MNDDTSHKKKGTKTYLSLSKKCRRLDCKYSSKKNVHDDNNHEIHVDTFGNISNHNYVDIVQPIPNVPDHCINQSNGDVGFSESSSPGIIHTESSHVISPHKKTVCAPASTATAISAKNISLQKTCLSSHSTSKLPQKCKVIHLKRQFPLIYNASRRKIHLVKQALSNIQKI